MTSGLLWMVNSMSSIKDTHPDDRFEVADSHRHGGPFDRGAADSYYRRGRRPHYFKGKSYMSPEIMENKMTAEEIAEYNDGYDWNEQNQNFKQWY